MTNPTTSRLGVAPTVSASGKRPGTRDPPALTASVRDAVEAVDPDLPLFEIADLHDAIYADKRVLDAFGTLFLLFGVGALFLTMVVCTASSRLP
ncbi:MAG TPA: hypothetical protein VGA37_16120 [Gemmatimonadales bacterium]